MGYASTLAAAFVVLLTSMGSASAQQCASDFEPMGTIPGADGPINAMVRWDPDGAGPEPEWLVVAGNFEVFNDVVANNIAAWDGNQWAALGEGIAGNSGAAAWETEVDALAVFEGKLFAAGRFNKAAGAAGNALVCWDGNQWEEVGNEFGPQSIIWTLAVYDGQLVAGGIIDDLGTTRREYLARFDGVHWTGFPNGGPNGPVFAMEVYQNELYIGGSFPSAGRALASMVARWDGTSFSAIGDGFDNDVTLLAVFDGSLYASGLFRHSGPLWRESIARFDGTQWHSVGVGLGGRPVTDLVATSRGLVVTGAVWTYPAWEHEYVVIWDGEQWLGIDAPFYQSDPPRTAIEYEGELFVAGTPSELLDGMPAKNIVKFDGAKWHPISTGTDERIAAMGSFGDQLIVAGDFRTIEGVKAKQIAAFDGEQWRPLGEGLTSEGAYAMTEFKGDLIVGGEFLRVGGVAARNIARWDGLAWHGLGEGLPGYVSSVGVLRNKIFARGFESRPGPDQRYMATWNGKRWTTVEEPSEVSLRDTIDGTLYACRQTRTIANERFAHILAWQGNRWEPVGEMFPNDTSWAYSIISYEGSLIAGGELSRDVTKSRVGVVRWEDGQWKPLHESTAFSFAQDLAVFDGDLYAVGEFEINGQFHELVRFDGHTWHPVDANFDRMETRYEPRYSLEVQHNALYIRGDFTQLNGEVAAYLARLSCEECLADCDRSTGDGTIDIFDFLCFQSRFVAGESYACDCDTSTGQGVCDVFDFLCFQAAFTQGCQ